MSDIAFHRQLYSKAYDYAEEGAKCAPNDSRILLRAGSLISDAGYYFDYIKANLVALKYLLQAYELNPNLWKIPFRIGDGYRLLGNSDEQSIDYLNRALKLNPANRIIWTALFCLHLEVTKDRSEAEKCCRKVLELGPNDAQTLRLVGRYHLTMTQDLEKAGDYLQKSIGIKPDVESHVLLARVHEKLAEAEREKARKLNPQHPWL